MPTTVEFQRTSTHTIQPRPGGGLRYVPSIPANPRLYVINNNGPYIGTSTNVKARFAPRKHVLWEMGVNPAGILIEIFRISIGGTPTTVNDLGQCSVDVEAAVNVWVTAIVDVEQLLIRIYTQVYGVNVRNTAKWQNAFVNPFPDALDWSIADGNGIVANGQIAYNGSL
ncbi:MAG TPA: hypothetical protein VGC07_06560 [Granulicella sp.]